MKKIIINEVDYEIVENKDDCIPKDELELKLTDYFDGFDYILGDWAYDKLRLKGFCDKENKNYKEINGIDKKDEYLKNQCAYGCKYFLIKKINKHVEE